MSIDPFMIIPWNSLDLDHNSIVTVYRSRDRTEPERLSGKDFLGDQHLRWGAALTGLANSIHC